MQIVVFHSVTVNPTFYLSPILLTPKTYDYTTNVGLVKEYFREKS